MSGDNPANFIGNRNVNTGTGDIHDIGGVEGGVHHYEEVQGDVNNNYYYGTGPTMPEQVFSGVPSLPAVFVGRDELVAELQQQLIAEGKAALSALDGKPGVGKTTLAVAIARSKATLKHFTGGVLWASIGQQPDEVSVLRRWAEALKVAVSNEWSTDQLAEAVRDAVGSRDFLIVIDDVWDYDDIEHLLLVDGASCVRLLTTRHRNVAERFAPGRITNVTELTEAQAVALLASACPEVGSYEEQLKLLANAVGCLPLALNLIAGYLVDHSALPDEINDAFHLLQAAENWLGLQAGRGKPTLEQTIRRSVDDLAEDARNAFLALAPFAAKPASFSLDALKQVGDCDAHAIGTLLRRNLLDKPSVERLEVHQTIAAVAHQQASAAQLLPDWQARHAQHYLDLMKNNREDWQLIAREWPQIQQAWQWVSSTGDEGLALGYIYAARLYHERQGLWQSHIAWLNAGITLTKVSGNQDDEATLLTNIGGVYSALGDKQEALRYYEQALPLRRAVGDRAGEANTLNNIGLVYSALGDKQQALDYYQQALPLSRAVGDRAGEAATLTNIGAVYSALGDKQQTLDYFQQALPMRRAVGDRAGEATTLNNIGKVYSDLGDKQQALDYFQQALPMMRAVGDRFSESVTLFNMAMIYYSGGNYAEAVLLLEQVVAIDTAVHHPDLASDTATLEQVRAKLAAQNPLA